MSKFVDYPQDKIAEQLERVKQFKTENPRLANLTKILAWEKWCTDYDYRKREWEFRQALAASVRPDVDYRQRR